MTDMKNPPYGWLHHRAETLVSNLAISSNPDYAGAARELNSYNRPREISQILSQISESGVRSGNVPKNDILISVLPLMDGDGALDVLLSILPNSVFMEKAAVALASRKSVPHLARAIEIIPAYECYTIMMVLRALDECDCISGVPVSTTLKISGIVRGRGEEAKLQLLAAKLLGKIGGSEAVSALVLACRKSFSEKSFLAVVSTALGKNRDIAIPALISGIESSPIEECKGCIWALDSIAGHAFSAISIRKMIRNPHNLTRRSGLLDKLEIARSMAMLSADGKEPTASQFPIMSGNDLKRFPPRARAGAQPHRAASEMKRVLQ